jgi:hypothetical protein
MDKQTTEQKVETVQEDLEEQEEQEISPELQAKLDLFEENFAKHPNYYNPDGESNRTLPGDDRD